jgi:putative ABC transport system permease protein
VGEPIVLKIAGRKTTLQVVGIVREAMAPDTIYLNGSYLAKTLGNSERTDHVWGILDPRESPDQIVQSLEAQFDQADLHVATITTASDKRAFVEFHFFIMIIPLGMAAFLLALVGGLGLMGTMTTNVIERRREIGVMRAIGATDMNVQMVFMVEALFIGLVSWLMSLVASLPPTHVLDDLIGTRFLKAPMVDTLPLDGALVWLIIVVVTVVVSCYWPARSASRTGIRELLAYE